MRIAMWSGPRNLSTAMMYSFAARGDCAVVDEPFYGAWLKAGGAQHPMREEILADMETDAEAVAAACIAPIPGGLPHLYLKLMPHHMAEGFPFGWSEECTHVHLIRHPARVVASYGARRDLPELEELGYSQQFDIYRRLPGPVIDSADIRADPAGALGRLCAEIGLPYTDAMLHWPAGGRKEDGIWAKHWYAGVHASTGFAGPEGPLPELDGRAGALVEEAMPFYTALAEARLK
ncbi:HAD family hydrolase [Pseudoroseicyclus sp. CXY001]|uniref:sulfotransferase-like domain-containing protein n=1 Tax=Pseudoroseicyclus sp. CXY001 TaxID=3242492 RepID=UPI0035711EAA